MIVFGDEALTRITRAIEHINGLARLEHGHGVLGFFGIKNFLTALCGMKYCMLKELRTESIANQPGAYKVDISLVDFDVFQQKREMLDSSQQEELMEAFSKRNPFLRLKQHWGAFSAYPDFPLDVRENGKIIGHLDPDYYFKAFDTIDADIEDFDSYDPKAHYSVLSSDANEEGTVGFVVGGEGIAFSDDQMPLGDQEFMDFGRINADQMPAGDGFMSGMTIFEELSISLR